MASAQEFTLSNQVSFAFVFKFKTLRERISRDDISQLQFGLTDSGEERVSGTDLIFHFQRQAESKLK